VEELMRRVILMMLFVIYSGAAFGLSDEALPSMEYAGKMLTLRWEPAGKNFKLYVTGYEAAAVKFKDLQIEASVGFGKNKKHLVVHRKPNYFYIKNSGHNRKVKLKLKIKGETAGEAGVNLP